MRIHVYIRSEFDIKIKRNQPPQKWRMGKYNGNCRNTNWMNEILSKTRKKSNYDHIWILDFQCSQNSQLIIDMSEFLLRWDDQNNFLRLFSGNWLLAMLRLWTALANCKRTHAILIQNVTENTQWKFLSWLYHRNCFFVVPFYAPHFKYSAGNTTTTATINWHATISIISTSISTFSHAKWQKCEKKIEN